MNLKTSILLIIFLGFCATLSSQNPHGTDFKIDCASCHSPDGWAIASKYWDGGDLIIPDGKKTEADENTFFSHATTGFPLTGQHTTVDCRTCHESLVFAEAEAECVSCHVDLHQMTVGDDCARCHTTDNWLIDNIVELHQDNGFPLLGNHVTAACTDCHLSETVLRFDRIGNDCTNCHLDDYVATTSPDHAAAGYSTDCEICHDLASLSWFWTDAGAANHGFFPLTKGHETNDCAQCHIGGNFVDTPTDCFACHEADFLATTSPDHEAGGFPIDCEVCHTTDPGWPASDFTQHDDLYFRIFSGDHKGEWNDCAECHTTPGNFKLFSCIDCKEHNDPNDLADEHNDVSGYSYTSPECFACHP